MKDSLNGIAPTTASPGVPGVLAYFSGNWTLNSNGFPKGKVGTKYKVHLPEKYSDTPGTPVDAVVVDIPFKESFNANTREVVKG